MEKKKMKLQFFAEIGDILAEHAEDFGEDDKTAEALGSITDKLKGLGYDVLINKRDAAEFVPATRLSAVVGQRDDYKSKLEEATNQLMSLKDQKGLSDDAQKQLDTLISSNNQLIAQLEETSVQLEIMSAATDALNPKDLIPFINMDAIKIDKKTGKVSGGVNEEVARIRSEKPYLFKQTEIPPAKGGTGGTGGDGSSGNKHADMNSILRNAAFGRSF